MTTQSGGNTASIIDIYIYEFTCLLFKSKLTRIRTIGHLPALQLLFCPPPSDPLHPQESLDLRSLIRRRLTTLSTFGGAVEHLINAVDKLVVNYVDALEEGLHIGVEK